VVRRFQLAEEFNWSAHDLWFHPVGQRLRDVRSRQVNAFNVHVLITMLEEFDPDVVYVCNLIGLGGLALIACLQSLKVPWVWQLGDNVPGILCASSRGTYQVLAEEFSRQIEGRYIVVSQQLIEQIKAQGVTLRGQVELLPAWITGQRPASRRSFYRGGTLRIMSVGQVAWHKGIDILIEAAARLRDSDCTRFVMDIYGKVYSPDFAAAIRGRDLENHVRLMGARPQPEIMDLYGDYDVFAFPTMEREPFGVVPLEAATRGCLPVITRRCGIAEWLVHGVHCLKAVRTADSFARVFRSIVDGEVPLEPIARRAMAAAWRDFHIDALFPKIERHLAAAAGQSRAGAGSGAEFYRMAQLAEQLTQVLNEEQQAVSA
jgi:glycosyltransferase involved in cell wall biosynthesis